jgi:hypothetical protein
MTIVFRAYRVSHASSLLTHLSPLLENTCSTARLVLKMQEYIIQTQTKDSVMGIVQPDSKVDVLLRLTLRTSLILPMKPTTAAAVDSSAYAYK